MDGLYRLAGNDVQVQAGGKTYTISREVGHLNAFAEIEDFIIEQRKKAIDLISQRIENFPAAMRDAAIRIAFEHDTRIARGATVQELNDFLESRDGLALLFWIGVRKHHPEVSSFDAAKAIVFTLADAEMTAIKTTIDKASGAAHLGNSSSQTADAERSESAGLASTAS